jgi:cell division protease FtsH
MVTKWGFSGRLGPLTYTEEEGEVFLGRAVTQQKQVSDVTVHAIDEEVRKIIDSAYENATQILTEKMDILHAMAAALVKYETIDQKQIDAIMNGREPPPPEEWTSGGPTAPVTDGDPSKSDKAAGDQPEVGKPAEQH